MKQKEKNDKIVAAIRTWLEQNPDGKIFHRRFIKKDMVKIAEDTGIDAWELQMWFNDRLLSALPIDDILLERRKAGNRRFGFSDRDTEIELMIEEWEQKIEAEYEEFFNPHSLSYKKDEVDAKIAKMATIIASYGRIVSVQELHDYIYKRWHIMAEFNRRTGL